MNATLGGHQAVQFVDDHPLDARHNWLKARGTDGDGHALWRGDEDVGGLPEHFLPVGLRGVSRSQTDANFLCPVWEVLCLDFLKRAEEVSLDVVRKRLDG